MPDFRLLEGRIFDLEKRPIAGATVIVENSRRGYKETAVSDQNGRWEIKRVWAMDGESFDLTISADKYLTLMGKVVFVSKEAYNITELAPDPRPLVRELVGQADALRQAKQFAAAKQKYEAAMTYDLASRVAEIGCGLCEFGMGNMAAAREHYVKARSLARQNFDLNAETMALELLGDLLVAQYDFAGAAGCFWEAAELDTDNSVQLLVKTADAYALGKNPAQALVFYQRALKLDPELEKELKGKIQGLGSVAAPEKEADTGAAPGTPTPAATTPRADFENSRALWHRDLAAPADKRLSRTLDLAAAYCRKLENAAFRYFCLEDVSEESWPGRSYAQKNTWRYDFQIVGKKSRVNEKRKLLEENGKKASRKSYIQESIFQSHLKFFAPIDLLGAKNQGWYHYAVLKEEDIAGQPCLLVRIEAREKNPANPLLEGTAAISTRDGSVLRIEIAQNSIWGLPERLQTAQNQGFDDVIVHDIHWFEKEVNGLRFPSHSEMREIYVKYQMQSLHYTVSYSYSNYSFFDVRITGIGIDKNGSKKKSDHGKK